MGLENLNDFFNSGSDLLINGIDKLIYIMTFWQRMDRFELFILISVLSILGWGLYELFKHQNDIGDIKFRIF